MILALEAPRDILLGDVAEGCGTGTVDVAKPGAGVLGVGGNGAFGVLVPDFLVSAARGVGGGADFSLSLVTTVLGTGPASSSPVGSETAAFLVDLSSRGAVHHHHHRNTHTTTLLFALGRCIFFNITN